MHDTARLQAAAAAFATEPLLAAPDGQVIDLARGYIPLLTNFTFEDRAAKGLRKGKADDKPEPPIHFSALELLQDHRVLLLTGLAGSGKTTFAKHVAFQLSAAGQIAAKPLVRNEQGDIHDEDWKLEGILPSYFTVDSPEHFAVLVRETLPQLVRSLNTEGHATKPGLLIILDTVERAGDQGPRLLNEALAALESFDNIKLLVLGETSSVKRWALSPEVIRHDLLPLLEAQRRQVVSKLTGVAPSEVVIGMGEAAANPAYFALALEASHSGNQAEELLDAWLAVLPSAKDTSENIASQLVARLNDGRVQISSNSLADHTSPPLLRSNAVQQLLAARHLAGLPVETAISLFHKSPVESEPILRSLLVRFATSNSNDLVQGLIRGSGPNAQLGALLASDFTDQSDNLREPISNHMLAIIEQGSLSAVQREKAGRVLSRLGDPRDLTALAAVPAGNFTMGSESHPNSEPLEVLSLPSFRIGLYPVVNRDFSAFVQETGRPWQSPEGFAKERQNVPATDLTWHDAMAYCEWLTNRWRSDGKIKHDEHVRLPTEPEWERASRGDQTSTDSSSPVYPWGIEWCDDTVNFEESGFNAPCAVGLFPKGRSPYGCFDMAGQVWEWCTTLWGDNMATPSFQYPWRDDGREALDAPGSIRRVLRGGCFSSSRLKACCTYRGSLEPAGFWRGNGFRIVVAQLPA